MKSRCKASINCTHLMSCHICTTKTYKCVDINIYYYNSLIKFGLDILKKLFALYIEIVVNIEIGLKTFINTT